MKYKIIRLRFLSNAATPGTFIPIIDGKSWGTYPLETETWRNKEVFTVKRLSDDTVFNVGSETNLGLVYKISLYNNNVKIHFQDGNIIDIDFEFLKLV